MENEIIYDNVTYQDIIRSKPYNWTLLNPPTLHHFWFESQNPFRLIGWIQRNVDVAFYTGGLYLLVIFGLKFWMKNRPAYDLRRPLMYWNAILGLFSILAFARMAPSLIFTFLQPQGFYTSICIKKGIDIPAAFWLYIFLLSKFIELGDTLFIVLRKRPLQFLQWFHHLVTMVVGWITFPLLEPVLRWYAVLNSGVHAVMYPYFSLRAGGVKVPSTIANFITTIQFLQMLVAFVLNLVSMYLYETGEDCYRHPLSIKIWSGLYGCFVLLFGKLFYENVVVGRKHKKAD